MANTHDHPFRILIIGSSELGKTNMRLHLIKLQRPDIYRIYLYIKDPLESKCKLLVNRREKVAIKKCKKSKSIQ